MATKYSSYNNNSEENNKSDVFGNIRKIFTTLPDKLEVRVRDHLKKVYGTLTLALLTAAFGVVANAYLNLASYFLVCSLSILGLMLAIVTTEATAYNESKRLAYMFGLSFLMGCQTGPLIEIVGVDDPTIVFNALLITMIVFGCFTMSALYAESTKYLHLGGILSSALICMMLTLLFAPYTPMFLSIIVWGGLAINIGFVLYDTQLIAEKCRRGDNDYIWHTVMLFVDFVNIFRYILIILKEKSDKDKRRR